MRLLAISTLVGLNACAHATEPERKIPKPRTEKVRASDAGDVECYAKGVQYAVGQKATAKLGGKLKREAGATTFRWIPPRTAVTMEYSASRLNVTYDDNYVIETITCG